MLFKHKGVNIFTKFMPKSIWKGPRPQLNDSRRERIKSTGGN